MEDGVESKLLIDSGSDRTLVARRLAEKVPGLELPVGGVAVQIDSRQVVEW